MDDRSVLEALPDGAALIDRDGAVRFTNRAWRAIVADTTAGQRFTTLLRGSLRLGDREIATLVDGIEGVLAGTRERVDVRVLSQLGHEAQQLELVAVPFAVDERGGALVRACVLQRADGGGAVREYMHFLQAILDAIPVPIFTKDADARYMRGNVAFEEFLKRPLHEIVGRSVFDLSPPELAAIYHQKDAALFADPGVQIYDSSVVDKRGQHRDVVFHKATFQNADGSLGGLVGVILDVTARKAAEARLRELFDHMRQAIIVFGEGGRVEEVASKQVAAIFGEGALAGTSVQRLLYPESWRVEAQAFDAWVEAAFASPDAWSEIAPLAPTEVEIARGGGEPRTLVLEFRPIFVDRTIARIMLLATDETEKRRLEREVRTRDRAHARQMAAMRRLVATGTQIFVSFLEAADRMLGWCEQAATEGPLEGERLEHVFQRVHTLTGEARVFELAELVEHATAVERRLSEARASEGRTAPTIERHAAIVAGLAAMRREIETARDLLVEASPLRDAVLDQITVRRSDLDRLLALAGDRDDELGEVARTLGSRPFAEAAVALLPRAPEWAEREGKRVRIEIGGGDALVPAPVVAALRPAFTHLVRNAIAHGIESPSERVSAGKSPEGRVRIACEPTDGGFVFFVEDDGRGFDEEALRAAAARSIGGARELAFDAGVSTAPEIGPLAGLGVGLGAVRSELAAVRYGVRAESAPNTGVRFVLTPQPASVPS